MRRAQDGFWLVYHDEEAIGEIKGIDQANWLVDRLKQKHGGYGFYHATYPTSRPSFIGKHKTHDLMSSKPPLGLYDQRSDDVTIRKVQWIWI